MTTDDQKIKQIQAAISSQERLRGMVDDSIIDVTIKVLQKELARCISTSQEPEQQRKMVTVLFMDVVDSTRMIRGMDPEESMEVLDVSLQSMAEPVREQGGNVTRFMGDGFLAVFGLPTAQENDPEQAVRAALNIISISEKISQSLKEEWGIESFQVRIGVNTGLIASGGVTEAGDTIMGSTINLAARLEKAAEPGTVLISRHTYQHVRGIFDMDKREPIEAKGFPEPVETYKILRLKSRAFRLMNRGVEGVETRMIGRELEMRNLQALSEKVIRDKVFRFVTIIGEAGMGKSRLLDEFEIWLKLHPEQVRFFKGRATLETQKQPYALLRDIFAFHLEILDNDPVQVVREKFVSGFQQVIQKDDQVEMKAYVVGHLLGYEIDDEVTKRIFENPQLARDRAFQYVKTYFQTDAMRSPIMIFLDDIHWADESSLDLLDYLRETMVDVPIMILALSRPSLFERKKKWGRGMGCETINLPPLSSEKSEQLVMEVLKKAESIPDTFRKTIVEHAEGNPFYLEELIRMLVEDGVILKEEPVWRIQSHQLVDLQIPPTLTGIIQARLDGLPKEEQAILQQASIVGKVFWDASLTYVNQNRSLTQNNVTSTLTALQNRDMIFRRDASAFSGITEYSFAHGILRDVVYETVLLKQRRDNHSLVADWLIGQRGGGAVEISGVIATHLVEAGRSEEAIDYFLKAAEAAAQKYANEEAIHLYQQALDLVPDEMLDRQFSISCSLESLWFLIGNREEQSGVLDRLADIADHLDDPHKKADVLLRKAWYLNYTSKFPGMLDVAQAAITLADQINAPDVTQEAFYALAWAQMQTEDLDHAKASAQRALKLAQQTGYRTGEGNVHNVLGLIDLTDGRYADARKHIEEFLHVTQEIGNQTRQLIALNSMVVILVMLGDYEKAREYGAQQLELASELGDWAAESSVYVNLAWVAEAEEDWQTADKYASKGISAQRETRHLDAVAEGLVWQGYAKLGLGQPGEAEGAFRESLEIRRGLGQEALQVESMAGLGQALLRGGDVDGAREYGEKVHKYISRDEDLSGTWEPLKIYWICYQILKAVDDPRKDDFLKDAFENLQKRAEKITDKAAQKRYLNHVPWHREILAEWERVL
jgi:predicted ATPase/class 3 adenylate cyclase